MQMMRLAEHTNINQALFFAWSAAPATWKSDATLDEHCLQIRRWRKRGRAFHSGVTNPGDSESGSTKVSSMQSSEAGRFPKDRRAPSEKGFARFPKDPFSEGAKRPLERAALADPSEEGKRTPEGLDREANEVDRRSHFNELHAKQPFPEDRRGPSESRTPEDQREGEGSAKAREGNGGAGLKRPHGVSAYRDKWTVRVTIDGKRRRLGAFATQSDAARAWDAHVLEHKLARPLNFPSGDLTLSTFHGFTTFAEAVWQRAPTAWKTLAALNTHTHQMKYWRRQLKNSAYDALKATFASYTIECSGSHPHVARVFNDMISRATLHMGTDFPNGPRRGHAALVYVRTATQTEVLIFRLNVSTHELTLRERKPSNRMPDSDRSYGGAPALYLKGNDITNVAGAPIACLDDTAFAAMFALWCEPDSEPSCTAPRKRIQTRIAAQNMWMAFHAFVTRHLAAMRITLRPRRTLDDYALPHSQRS